jgi:CheY-like chemotaxis protein
MSTERPSILFLDDDHNRIEQFRQHCTWCTVVETAQEAIDKLSNEEFNIVFLDHDLGGEQMVSSDREDCGMEVVRWISENKPTIDQIIVHTLNIDAGLQMVSRLKGAGYPTDQVPFLYFFSRVYPQLKTY